jgi:hypothetical protein
MENGKSPIEEFLESMRDEAEIETIPPDGVISGENLDDLIQIESHEAPPNLKEPLPGELIGWCRKALEEALEEPSADLIIETYRRILETARPGSKLHILPDDTGMIREKMPSYFMNNYPMSREEAIGITEENIANQPALLAFTDPDDELKSLVFIDHQIFGTMKERGSIALASKLDSFLMGTNNPNLDKEYKQTLKNASNASALGHKLMEYFGVQMADGYLALTKDSGGSEKGEITEEPAEELYRWIFGNLEFLKMKKRLGRDPERMLNEWKNRLIHNSLFRRKVKRAIRRITLRKYQQIALTLVRGSFNYLGHVKSCSDYEWAEKAVEDFEKFNESEKTNFENIIQKAKKILEEHPEAPSDENMLTREEIDKWTSHFQRISNMSTSTEYCSYQRALIHELFAKASRYTGVSGLDMKSWEKGFPETIMQERAVSCFSGTWLLTALLANTHGIGKDFLFAHINQSKNGTMGDHGALVFLGERNNLVLFDLGHNIAGVEIPWKMALKTDRTKQQHLKDLCAERHTEPVHLEFRSDVAEACGVHRDMILLPINHGIANGHLYHLGVGYFEEKKWEEARFMFELALTMNPRDAESLYYLAQIESANGDHEEAEGCLMEALSVFHGHLPSKYMLAELKLAKLEGKEALRLYREVAKCPHDLWKGEGIKIMAKLIVPTLEKLINNEPSEAHAAKVMADLLKEGKKYSEVLLSEPEDE